MNDQKEPYVVVIGSSNMDLNVYSERLPTPGETVTGGTFKQFLGGKGANQAVASMRAGAPTRFIGKIGKDAFGDQMIAQLTEEGIDTRHILRDPEAASGLAFILIDKKGENMISVAPGANFLLSPEDIKQHEDLIQNAEAVVAQMEIPIETIAEIFRIASRGKPIKILNPAPLKAIPASILPNIDIIVPNEGELYQLHALLGLGEMGTKNRETIVKASKEIAALGIGTIITTLGKKGCLIYVASEDRVSEVPAIPVKAVDTVGAGDCFNGVLASHLCKGDDLITAVTYATAAASIAVTRKGAQASIPYKREILQRYKSLKF